MFVSKFLLRLPLLTSLAIFLGSCGGGGGSSASNSTSAQLGEEASDSVTLSWEAPTQRVDGEPIDDLEGYRVHYGPASMNYLFSLNVGLETKTTVELETAGRYYFAVTAYNRAGQESRFSEEVAHTVRSR